MATPHAAPDIRPESTESSRPDPACLQAQKWIEAVTGKSFGDNDFRGALENGVLLCELLSAIRPGLVKKINRLPTPIAGLDNLSVFLRGCEQLGLKGSQLFDPGDLQDTSIRANLTDSDCSRKLKNVLNTVFWLAKAASTFYNGPVLHLKEFEGLLANMKDPEEAGEGSRKRGVRDSGLDCWDSERSESLSPPRHARDDSLDSLDSFGSRSQHSPSPDVANRGNAEGREADPETDAGKRPDVQKDDMSARRAASSEARTPVAFNQFLPNRSNAGFYLPNARRRPRTEDGEQRRPPEGKKPQKSVTWATERQDETETCERTRLRTLETAGIKAMVKIPSLQRSPPPPPEKAPSPEIILRRHNDFLSGRKSAWDSSEEGESEEQKVPDVLKDDLASRRAARGPAVPQAHRFVAAPPPFLESKDRERWESIRRSSQVTLKDARLEDAASGVDHGSSTRKIPDEDSQDGDAERPKVMPDKQADDLAFRRARPRPLRQDGPNTSTAGAMSPADVQKWERLRMSEASLSDEENPPPEAPPKFSTCSPEVPVPQAQVDVPLADCERSLNHEEDEEEKDEKIPDLKKDDMMARRTGVFQNRSSSLASHKCFLPSPASNFKARLPDGGLGGPRSGSGSIPTSLRALPRGTEEVLTSKEVLSEADKDNMVAPKSSATFQRFLPVPVTLQNKAGKSPEVEQVPKNEMEKSFLTSDDDLSLPPMMMVRRVAFTREEVQSVSMGDMAEREEAGQPAPTPAPPSGPRHEPTHEHYDQDEDDQWQSDLARWKNRRRCASRGLIQKEEERKRLEKINGEVGDKRKSIKTYKEIVEDKERREAELCEEYRGAATAEEAAAVLRRYALRFTISDATLDFLNLPRAAADLEREENAGRTELTPTLEGGEPSAESCSKPSFQASSDSTPLEHQEEEKAASPPSQSAPSKSQPATRSKSDSQPPKSKPSTPTIIATPTPAHPSVAPPSRPVPLLAAKPYCQPRSSRGVKTDGLVRVNGDADASPVHSPSKKEPSLSTPVDAPPLSPVSPPSSAVDGWPPAHAPSPSSSFSSSSSSTIGSLFSGRNCVTKTTIVTELTQTVVGGDNSQGNGSMTTTAEEKQAESLWSSSLSTSASVTQEPPPATATETDQETSMSIETPVLNLAKRVNHWVWDPNEERKRVEKWQREQERLLQEQYQKEQEKLKKEWEKAQLEAQEEERKHNEEERKILEETVAPLNNSSAATSPPTRVQESGGRQNGCQDVRESGEPHPSQLHFLQDREPAKKYELLKTASLDRNTPPNLLRDVKRSDSHDGLSATPTKSSPLVSGKKLCSGCSQPVGKGAAMIIQTLGLFFHMHCFKCATCEGDLGTDVRIRHGLLSCHQCYLTAIGGGQPTTL
ncbi:LIM and calponin homology domains-containing protein 1-like [Stigmatopora nigra]